MNVERTFKAAGISPWASLILVAEVVGKQLLTQSAESFTAIASQIPITPSELAMFLSGVVGTAYAAVKCFPHINDSWS